jgi:hypothetical protein
MNRRATNLRLDNGFWSFHRSGFARKMVTSRPFLFLVLTILAACEIPPGALNDY